MWLDAPVEVRASRLGERVETPQQLRAREESDARRYREYYDIDIGDLSIYDLTLNTDALSENGMRRTVSAAIDDVLTAKR